MKQPGLCTDCGTECFEIVSRFPADHPIAGEVCRIGPMIPCGTQVEFLLSDNTVMTLTFCVDCAGRLSPEHYPSLMDIVRTGWERELDDEYRKAIGASPWPEKDSPRIVYRMKYYSLWIIGKLGARRFRYFCEDCLKECWPTVGNALCPESGCGGQVNAEVVLDTRGREDGR